MVDFRLVSMLQPIKNAYERRILLKFFAVSLLPCFWDGYCGIEEFPCNHYRWYYTSLAMISMSIQLRDYCL